MLDGLRSVPLRTSLSLIVAGAVVAILLAVAIDGLSGSAAATKPATSIRIDTAVAGNRAAGRARPKLMQEAESPPAEEKVPLARMVGQRFMVGLREANPSGKLLKDARRGEIGGVLMFAENSTPAEVGAAAAGLQHAAALGNNRPLLIAIDQEGVVKRFEEGPPNKPLSSVSSGGAKREGIATGNYLRQYGINTDLAPVVDLGLPGSFIAEQGRTISRDPTKVADVADAFAAGLERTRVMPVPKHFPGLGSASVNSDEAKSVVEAGVSRSLIPYGTLIGGGVPAIMVSTAFYTKLDPSHGAAWSRKIVGGLLRRKLAFKGMVISDDLSSEGVAASLSTAASAATASAEAGVDMLMIGNPDSFRSAYEAVLKAAEDGQVSERNLVSSYRRILAAKERFGS